MGIFLSLFYIATAYLAAATVFGDLAQYHIQVYLAILTLVFSLFAMRGSHLSKMPQTYAIILLPFAITMSLILAGVTRTTPDALEFFIPNAIAYFFIALNFRTRMHLQLLTLSLFGTALWAIVNGTLAMTLLYASPYMLSMHLGEERVTFLHRLRGVGFLNDPNDFAQFLLGLIPCMFFFWRKGKALSNFFLVYLPAAIMLFGMFETHSRGALVALLAMLVVAGRRKLGIVPSIVVSGILYLGLSAAGWSGGRDVSMDAGEDRMGAWSVGLELLKHHPLFGVGFNRFSEYNTITAHNTFVVCAAEIGLFGFILWLLMLVAMIRDVTVGAALPEAAPTDDDLPFLQRMAKAGRKVVPATPVPALQSAGLAGAPPGLAMMHNPAVKLQQPQRTAFAPDAVSAANPYRFAQPEPDDKLPDDEIRRLCNVVVVSLAGYLVAGWFLSRAYTMVLFFEAGIATVVYRMAWNRGLAPPPLPAKKAIKYAFYAAITLIFVLYMTLRISNLTK